MRIRSFIATRSAALIVAASVLAGFGCGVGHAAPDPNWADCSPDQAGRADTTRIINGCTKVIEKGNRASAKERSVAFVNRGIAHYQRGDLEKATKDYSDAVRLDGKNTAAWHNRADLKLRKGDLEGAITDY